MTDFTRDWLADRRKLLDAATEGPWRASLLAGGVRYEDGSSSYRCGIYPGTTQGPPPVLITNSIDARDAALIADARTSLPRVLDALEAVLAERGGGAERFGPDFEAGVQKGLQLARRAIEAALRGES